MRKYLKWGIALMVANLALVSCEDDNDTLINAREDKPVLTLESATASGVEGEDVTFTMTTDRPLAQDAEFKVEVVNGESVANFRDFMYDGDETTIDGGGYQQGQIGYVMTFPAYATSHTFTITLDRDLLIEGTENLELLIRSGGNGLVSIAEGSERLSVAVSDYVSNDIGISLTWAGDFYDAYGTLQEGPYRDFDFDLYVFDSNLNEITNGAGYAGEYSEFVELEDLADGTYYIFADLYARGEQPAVPAVLPAEITISKFGVWSETITLDYMTNSTASGGNGMAGGETLVALLIKTGDTYVLETEDGEVLASGRFSFAGTKNIR